MEPQHHAELVTIMARLAAGDEAAVVTLCDRFGGHIAAAVRRQADERHVRLGAQDLQSLVFDCCDELARVAGAWSPDGGALPWVWARRRIQNVVDRSIGQHSDSIDDMPPGALEQHLGDAPPPPSGVDDPSLGAVLGAVAPDHAGLRLVLAALDRARISERDRDVLLHHADERCAGNAAPAVTVAEVCSMSPANVRQVVRRAKQKLRALAAADPRFALLADLPLLA